MNEMTTLELSSAPKKNKSRNSETSTQITAGNSFKSPLHKSSCVLCRSAIPDRSLSLKGERLHITENISSYYKARSTSYCVRTSTPYNVCKAFRCQSTLFNMYYVHMFNLSPI